MNRTISTAVLLAAAIGCGSSVPPARVASTDTAVQSARASGAESIPEANKHLRLAENELASAKQLNDKKKGDEAEAMFRRASADAALAAALADEWKTKAAVKGAGSTDGVETPPQPGQ